MNVFNKNLFKINYNSYLSRISIQNQTDFINILESTFQILLSIIKNGEKFTKVVIEENNVLVEIIKLNGNLYIISTNKSYFYNVLIENEMTQVIKDNLNEINQKIDEIKLNKKRKNGKMEKQKNVKKPRHGNLTDKPDEELSNKEGGK